MKTFVLLNIDLANVKQEFQWITIERFSFDIDQAYQRNRIAIIYSNLLVAKERLVHFDHLLFKRKIKCFISNRISLDLTNCLSIDHNSLEYKPLLLNLINVQY